MKSEMVEDVTSSPALPEEFSIEGISSPLMLEFCDDGDFFLDNLEPSDLPSFSTSTCSISATSSAPTAANSTVNTSNGDSEGQCCYVDNNSFTFDPATITALYDSQHPYGSNQLDIISSAGAAAYQLPVTPVYNQEQFHQALCTDAITGGCYNSTVQIPAGPPDHQMASEYECLATMPGYTGFDPSPPCSYYPDAMGMGFFSRAMMIGLEPEIVADPMPETVQRAYSSGEMQMMGDCQNLVGVNNISSAKSLPTTDISALDNVCRLTAEQRKEKIHRYLKKRNERNFSKKIKYACRKTLADNRPRVRGRFAKNDELSEATVRAGSSNHEYDDYDVGVKEDRDVLSSDPNNYQWRELLEIQLLS